MRSGNARLAAAMMLSVMESESLSIPEVVCGGMSGMAERRVVSAELYVAQLSGVALLMSNEGWFVEESPGAGSEGSKVERTARTGR